MSTDRPTQQAAARRSGSLVSFPFYAQIAPSPIWPAMRRRAITATAFFLLALSWSPLLPKLLGLPFNVALFSAFVVLAGLTALEGGISLRTPLLCLLLLSACFLMMLLSQSPQLLLRLAPLPLLIFAARQTIAVHGLPQRLCRLMTVFLMVGVAGALIGEFYALAGGEPILSIDNIDGRENSLYLTTMSNFNVVGLIRPSFIYDEPGAFSFIVCATVALREVLGRGRHASFLLMIGGLVTLSLTHFLITLIYLIFRIGPLKTIALVAALLIPLAPLAAHVEELNFLVNRFAFEDGKLEGDNRSNQIENFFAVVNPGMVLFGNIECDARPEGICDEHGDITSSPVTPTYRGGLVALIVQLSVHAGLIAAFFRRKRFRFSALALTLLLLQRPYFGFGGYGYITFLLLLLMWQVRTPIRLGSATLRGSDNLLRPASYSRSGPV